MPVISTVIKWLYCVPMMSQFWVVKKLTQTDYIAQCSLSITNTYMHIVGDVVYMYTSSFHVYDHLRAISLWYFSIDTVYMLREMHLRRTSTLPSNTLSASPAFIAHHIGSIIIGVLSIYDAISISNMSQYMFCIELSNAFINIREIAKYAHSPLHDLITVMFAATYVPLRTVGLGYMSYFMYTDSNTWESSLATKSTLYTLYSILLYQSIAYSKRVVISGLKVLLKRRRAKQVGFH